MRVHFTSYFEGLRDQGNLNGMKKLHGVLHDVKVDNLAWSIGYCIESIKKEAGLMQNTGP